MGHSRIALVEMCFFIRRRPSFLLLVRHSDLGALMSVFRPYFDSRRLDPLHPVAGFDTIISVGRVDQNQARTPSIGGTRGLTLVLQYKVEVRSQRVS